jgi:hypothetical protein
MNNRRIVLVGLILSSLYWGGGVLAWDDTGVRLVIEKAIDSLPKPIKKFYEQREAIILEHVVDPIRSGQRLTFELDRFETFPFEGIPEDRQSAVSKFGEETIEEAGDLPWKLQDTFQKLIEAYRTMDIEAIETLSAEIAFLVGELHNPVNVSKYGDGEPIDQDGLRERFDERLLEVYGEKIKFDTPAAVYLDRPGEYAFNIARRAYIWVDNILLHDYIARQGVMSYDRFYYEGLWLRSSIIINQMLQNLSRDAASYWYTAWIEAGKPELPK